MTHRFRRCATTWLYCLVMAGVLVPVTATAEFYFVNSTNDTTDATPGDGVCADADANCTLRAAVMEANAFPGADRIYLDRGTYTLSIPGNNEHAAASGDLDILDAVTIQGLDPAATVIDGGGLDRVFEIIFAGNVTISRLAIQNGVAGFNTPGFFANFAGGGISNVGDSSLVVIRDVEIRNNSAQSGGGVFNVFSTMEIYNSTLHNNAATAGSGGGAAESLASFLRIYNSTLSANTATLNGGGLSTSNNTAILNNVTVVNNGADSDLDGNGNGGGISRGITAPTLSNSIVAGNFDPGGEAPDCTTNLTSAGYNLIGDDSGCTISAAGGDLIGTAGSPIDPLLGPLLDNGGLTPTHALLNGSPALDSGNPAAPGSGSGACEATDQRSTDRAWSTPCDMGAFEQALTQGTSFIVNSTADQTDAIIGDARCETAPGNDTCTLRAAIQETNALVGADLIVLPPGTYLFGIPGPNENAAATGDLDVSDTLEIQGAGPAVTIVDAVRMDRVFHAVAGSNLTVSGITVQNGLAVDGASNGGGILNESGTLIASDCLITGNEAASGGGLFNIAFNRMVVTDSVISNNTASQYGGGVANFTLGTATIENSTISGNIAATGGGLMNSFLSNTTVTGTTISDNQAQQGGGIGTLFGDSFITLINSTVSGNRATFSGGGISATSGTDTINLRSVTVTGNRAMAIADGGGINSAGTLNVRNSIIAANIDVGGEAPDCSGVLTSQGHNLLGDDTACTFLADVGDIVGDAINPLDPMLGPLSDNGGVTLTHALLPGSPAFNSGNTATPGSGGRSCEANDQRGADRVLNQPCDIGAVESVIADLAVTLSDSVDPSLPGEALDYTIVVSNNGPDAAGNVVLTDTLPAGASFAAVSGTGWSCTTGATPITCTLPTLASGASSTLTLSILAPTLSGDFTNTVSIAADTVDLDNTNNSATELNAVLPVADLAVTLSDSVDPSLPGEALDYTIVVSNNGPDAAGNVVLTDTLPAGASFAAVSGTGWSCTTGATPITCTLPTLASGASSTLTLSILAPTLSGDFTNTVSIAADTVDLDNSNNGRAEPGAVNAPPVVIMGAGSRYVLDGPLTTVAPDISLSDQDDTHLQGATVQITVGYQPGLDELHFADTHEIAGNWDPVSGRLTLSGGATVDAYQSALRSVAYASAGQAAVTGSRTLSYQVSDGDAQSLPQSGLLSVEPPPVTADRQAPAESVVMNGDPPASAPIRGGVVFLPGDSTAASEENQTTTQPDEAGQIESTPEPPDTAEYKPEEPQYRDPSTDDSDGYSDELYRNPPPVTQYQPEQRHSPGAGHSRTTGRRADRTPAPDPRYTAPTKPEHTPNARAGSDASAEPGGDSAELWKQLDYMKQQMNQAAGAQDTDAKLVIGTAKGLSVVLFAGFMNWYLKAGSLLAGLLSSVPLWTPFDPLPILSLSRQERERQRANAQRQLQQESRCLGQLGGLLDSEVRSPAAPLKKVRGS